MHHNRGILNLLRIGSIKVDEMNPILTEQDVRNSKFLQALSMDERSLLIHNSRLIKMSSKSIIYNYDESFKAVYIVLSGSVKLGLTTSSGNTIIKEMAYEGDVFGENVFVAQGKRKEFAKCFDGGKVLEIKLEFFKHIVQNNPVFANLITETMIERLQNLQVRMEAFANKSAKQRIVEFIKNSARIRGIKIGINECLINHGMSHKEIAFLTDTSRQTVARILGELKKTDIIHFGARKPGKILIRDRQWIAA